MDYEVADVLVLEIPGEDLPMQLVLVDLARAQRDEQEKPDGQRKLRDLYRTLHSSLKLTGFVEPVIKRTVYGRREEYTVSSDHALDQYIVAIQRRLQEA